MASGIVQAARAMSLQARPANVRNKAAGTVPSRRHWVGPNIIELLFGGGGLLVALRCLRSHGADDKPARARPTFAGCDGFVRPTDTLEGDRQGRGPAEQRNSGTAEQRNSGTAEQRDANARGVEFVRGGVNDEASAAGVTTYHCGEFRVDVADRRFAHAGREISLEP